MPRIHIWSIRTKVLHKMKCDYCPAVFPDSMNGLVAKTFHEIMCCDLKTWWKKITVLVIILLKKEEQDLNDNSKLTVQYIIRDFYDDSYL